MITAIWPAALAKCAQDGLCPYCAYYYSADFTRESSKAAVWIRHNCLKKGKSFSVKLGKDSTEVKHALSRLHTDATARFSEQINYAENGLFNDIWVNRSSEGLGQLKGEIHHSTARGQATICYDIQFSINKKDAISELNTNRLIRFIQNHALHCTSGSTPLSLSVSIRVQKSGFDIGGHVIYTHLGRDRWIDFGMRSVSFRAKNWWGWHEVRYSHDMVRFGLLIASLARCRHAYTALAD